MKGQVIFIWFPIANYFGFVTKLKSHTNAAHHSNTTEILRVTNSREQRKFKNATGQFSHLLNSLQTAVKAVASALRTNGVVKLDEVDNETIIPCTNVHGEEQKKLDVFANKVFISILKSSYTTCLMVSEENETCIEVKPEDQGKYIVCFDPLDGSANIDCLAAVGSIFAIYRKQDTGAANVKDALQPGNQIVCAGYALYGTATALVISVGSGLNGFIYNPCIGEFILTEPNMCIPEKGYIYSINEGHSASWSEGLKNYIASIKDPSKGKPYGTRYAGTLVADVHRMIKIGGIYIYPGTQSLPDGKIRLLYECNPMAYLITHAGGLASNGKMNILDIAPKTIHERSPIYIGSKKDVEEVLSCLSKNFQ